MKTLSKQNNLEEKQCQFHPSVIFLELLPAGQNCCLLHEGGKVLKCIKMMEAVVGHMLDIVCQAYDLDCDFLIFGFTAHNGTLTF